MMVLWLPIIVLASKDFSLKSAKGRHLREEKEGPLYGTSNYILSVEPEFPLPAMACDNVYMVSTPRNSPYFYIPLLFY